MREEDGPWQGSQAPLTGHNKPTVDRGAEMPGWWNGWPEDHQEKNIP